MCSKYTTEVWYDVPGYEDFYQLSNLDRLKSLPRPAKTRNGGTRMTIEKIKEFVPDGVGFLIASLWKDGKGKSFCLHQLKLMVFVGPCPAGMECRHLDGNASNNDITNLAWGTHQENIDDKKLHGTNVGGRKGNSYKLKGKQQEIVKMRKEGYSVGDLSSLFGVSTCAIYGCLSRYMKD